MKHIINYLLSAAAIVLCAACLLTSCDNPLGENTENPPTAALPAAEFSVMQYDYEQGAHPDSSYVFESVLEKDGTFKYGLEKSVTLVPNIFPNEENRIEFVISSNDPDFKGVNASSSAKCINIVQDGNDNTHFHLEWNGEGYSTITFWNGEGANKKEVSFMATSKKEIPMEGIIVKYGPVVRDDFEWHRMIKFNANDPRKSVREDSGSDDVMHIVTARNASREINDVLEIIGPKPLNANVGPVDVANRQLVMDFTYDLPYHNNDGVREPSPTWDRNIRDYPGFSWFPSDTYVEEPREVTEAEWFKERARKIRPCDLRDRRIKYLYSGVSIHIATGTLYYDTYYTDELGQIQHIGTAHEKHFYWNVYVRADIW